MRPVLVVLFSVAFVYCDAQEVAKYRAYEFDVIRPANGEADSLEKCDILVILTEHRLKIYAQETQEYDAIKEIDSGSMQFSSRTLSYRLYNGVDLKGYECNIRFVYINDVMDRITIEYPDATILYLVRP